MNQMKKVNNELRIEMAKKSSLLKEVFESQDSYLKTIRPWSEMSDYLYLRDNLK